LKHEDDPNARIAYFNESLIIKNLEAADHRPFRIIFSAKVFFDGIGYRVNLCNYLEYKQDSGSWRQAGEYTKKVISSIHYSYGNTSGTVPGPFILNNGAPLKVPVGPGALSDYYIPNDFMVCGNFSLKQPSLVPYGGSNAWEGCFTAAGYNYPSPCILCAH